MNRRLWTVVFVLGISSLFTVRAAFSQGHAPSQTHSEGRASDPPDKPTDSRVSLGMLVGEAKPPTCTQPVGKWQNERKSVLEIKTYNAATGAISGQYTSQSGASSTPYPVVGWINSAPVESSDSCRGCNVDHAELFTFAVRWGALGSVSSWTGTVAVNSHSGLERISALWHTTRPNSGFDWDHTLTGADRFDPIV